MNVVIIEIEIRIPMNQIIRDVHPIITTIVSIPNPILDNHNGKTFIPPRSPRFFNYIFFFRGMARRTLPTEEEESNRVSKSKINKFI